MTNPRDNRRPRREAARWLARLNARTVSVADLDAFRTWREDRRNRDAYGEVEAAWRAAEGLRADPGIGAALADARSRRSRPGMFPRALTAGAVAAAIGITLATWWWSRPLAYATAAGERRVVQLADGSELQLDTDSRVTVRFDRDLRALTLVRGQALFRVAHDRARPFQVAAGDALVTATGTVFDVRRLPRGARVTLVQGGVVVEDRGLTPKRWRLSAGEQIGTDAPAAAHPRAVDAAAATSWTTGRLTFEGTPLATAVREINRYGGPTVRLSAGVDGAKPISGAFDVGDPHAFAEAVAALYGLSLIQDGRELRLGPPENKF